MARKNSAPPPPGGPESHRPHAGGSEEQDGQSEREERFGPLAVARMRKDDGRALIIYSREEHERT
jgi:hypothetical protein